MADLHALQVASGPLSDLGYAEEVSLGHIPEDVQLKTCRRRSTTLGLTKDTSQSEEVRKDRMSSGSRHTIRRSGGDIVTEVSCGSHADFMVATLGGVWETPVPIDASDVNLTATLTDGILVVTATSFDFIAAGLLVGASATFLDTGTAALNGELFTVISHAANTVRLLPPVGFELASPASVTAGTLGVKGARTGMGNIYRSFVFERGFTDIGSFVVYTGQRFNSMAAEIPATGLAVITYGLMGKDALPVNSASIDGVDEITLTPADFTSLTFDAAGKTITAAGGDWVAEGFAPGDRLLFSGAGITDPQNRNPRTLIAVTPTVLTVAEAIQSGGPYTGAIEVTRVGLPSYAQPSDEEVLASASGVLLVNGVAVATVTGMSFGIDNGMGGSEVVGQNTVPVNLYGNRAEITGSISVLFDRGGVGEDLYNAFDQELDAQSIVIRLDKSDGTGGIAVVFPRVKINSGTIGDAVPTGLPITAEFSAHKPYLNTPGLGASPIYLYDTEMEGVEPIVAPLTLTFVSESGGVATMNVTGGVAPYSFEPDGAGSAVLVPVAGNFTHDYVANGDYDPTIDDAAGNSDTVNVDITTA
jgi:hypothetical protein